ncbi:MAG: ABC transporter permease [Deltaproteobacteria bacterium]|nr:ABC transporter permease [Deltaproteobacteria bacterium]
MIEYIFLASVSEGLIFGFIAIGVFITFRVLSFPDLTVDGSFVTGGSVAAVMIAAGYNPFLATIAALFAGLVAGGITALLNTLLKINALLSGILMMVGLYSINLRIMHGANIPLIRSITIFDSVAHFFSIKRNSVLIIYTLIILAVIVFLILNWFLRTEIGLALRASGDNEQMVRGLGSDTNKNLLLGCAISNGLVALGGSLVAQSQGFCDVNMGIGMIVMGLAAVIIGEGVLHPRGIAKILFACFVGTFIYRLFITIVLRLGLTPGDLKLITAILVVVVIAVPYIKKRLRGEWVPPAARM